mmetsp:Transcript_7992/g.18229  ORF Transcript_7992/g.18229 Transcript_7992/m.18229 type:complete len:285 (-) Transcript_7992:656-1510(-)
MLHPRCHHGQADSWKDVRVVPLSRNVLLAFIDNRFERAPTCEENLPSSPVERLLSCAFRGRGWVRKCKNNWSWVDLGHVAANILIKNTTLCADSNQSSRIHLFDNCAEISNDLMIMSIWKFVVRHLCKIGSSPCNQTLGVDQPDLLASLFHRQSLINHLFNNQICDACSGLSCTHEDKGFVLKSCSLHSSGTHEPCKCDRCSSLNVVIESANLIMVFSEKSECICVAEVLKLNEDSREFFVQRSDDLMQKCIILLPCDAGFWNSCVKWILKKLGVVGSNINGNR